MNELTVSVHDRLDSIDAAQWSALFPNHPDSPELVRLTADCGMDGFAFHSIVVRRGNEPILLLPLFDARFRLASLLDGMIAGIVGALPLISSPRLLGVGIVEGEWGQVGCATGADAAAWKLAIDALWNLAKKKRASLLVFLNFTPEAAAALPYEFSRRLARIDTIPCAHLPIDFATPDEYQSRLSKNMRKDLRRKLAAAGDVRIERPRSPDPWLDYICDLYVETIRRAPLSLGIQRKDFFRRVAGEVPGAHYVLYFKDERLLAFNLLIERSGALIDKYFCMDLEAGRLNNLYFVSWMENVRYCCEKRLKTYHAGPGAEATKARLGAQFIPSITMFRHRIAPVHGVLRLLRPLIAYKPAITLTAGAGADGGAGENLTQ